MERAKCSPDVEEERDTCLSTGPRLSRCLSCRREDRSIFPLSIQLSLPTSFDKRAGCCVLAWYWEHVQPMPSTGHTQPIKSSEGSVLLCHCHLLRDHIWHRHSCYQRVSGVFPEGSWEYTSSKTMLKGLKTQFAHPSYPLRVLFLEYFMCMAKTLYQVRRRQGDKGRGSS